MIAERTVPGEPVVHLTQPERERTFREGINQVRAAAHQFINAELFGALDETLRLLNTLEKQYELFQSIDSQPEPPEQPGYKGRRLGIDIRPGSVRLARLEAGLSLRQIAAGQVSAPAIHLIEHGKTRPSMETLRLIARQTGKPLDFFIAETPWNQYITSLGVELPTEVQA